jgi:hypothetical protein
MPLSASCQVVLGAYFVPAEKPKAKATTEREAYLSPLLVPPLARL